MRAYKFRGKRVDDGEWIYGSYVNVRGISYIYVDNEDMGIPNYFQVIPETVGQFTGLKDKNGKEIYEGDVVNGNCDEHMCLIAKAVVEWNNKYFLYECNEYHNGRKIDTHEFGNIADLSDLEIIGNIHEVNKDV